VTGAESETGNVVDSSAMATLVLGEGVGSKTTVAKYNDSIADSTTDFPINFYNQPHQSFKI
jgi:hypothetical protein